MPLNLDIKRIISLGILFAFLLNSLGPLPQAYAQELYLPAPGQMVALSPAFSPVVLKGIKLDPKNPFSFHFYVDTGDHPVGAIINRPNLKNESAKLIKYFLASLTIPEKDLWVNLSPYEKDRIVPKEFGQTEMGRDLLAEDYLLKQITASIIYPESKLGHEFWAKVYAQAESKYGTTNIPINTFNKVWIVPDKAVVYENNGTAFVLENHLKVMLEQDYLSLSRHVIPAKSGIHNKNKINTLGSQIIREIVIPALTKEVNEGKNFSQLRQVFYSLILATWYKKKIKDSIFNKVYSNQNKISGVSVSGDDKDKIYQEYLKAFKKGVFNYIKEESDQITGQTIPRKYFSGGVVGSVDPVLTYEEHISPAQVSILDFAQLVDVNTDFGIIKKSLNVSADKAMTGFTQNEILNNLRTTFSQFKGEYQAWLIDKIKTLPEGDSLARNLDDLFRPILNEIAQQISLDPWETDYKYVNDELDRIGVYLYHLKIPPIGLRVHKRFAKDFLGFDDLNNPKSAFKVTLHQRMEKVYKIILDDQFNENSDLRIQGFSEVFERYHKALKQRIDQLETFKLPGVTPVIAEDQVKPQTWIEFNPGFKPLLNQFLMLLLKKSQDIRMNIHSLKAGDNYSLSSNKIIDNYFSAKQSLRSLLLAFFDYDIAGYDSNRYFPPVLGLSDTTNNLIDLEGTLNALLKVNFHTEMKFSDLADDVNKWSGMSPKNSQKQLIRILRALQAHPNLKMEFIDSAMSSLKHQVIVVGGEKESQKEEQSAKLDKLIKRALFTNEDEMWQHLDLAPLEKDKLIQITKQISELSGVLNDGNLYRGLKLTPEMLNKVLSEGLNPSYNAWKISSGTYYPFEALAYAFETHSPTAAPKEDFLTVVFKYSAEQYKEFETKSIPAKDFEAVWLYDKSTRKLIDIKSLVIISKNLQLEVAMNGQAADEAMSTDEIVKQIPEGVFDYKKNLAILLSGNIPTNVRFVISQGAKSFAFNVTWEKESEPNTYLMVVKSDHGEAVYSINYYTKGNSAELLYVDDAADFSIVPFRGIFKAFSALALKDVPIIAPGIVINNETRSRAKSFLSQNQPNITYLSHSQWAITLVGRTRPDDFLQVMLDGKLKIDDENYISSWVNLNFNLFGRYADQLKDLFKQAKEIELAYYKDPKEINLSVERQQSLRQKYLTVQAIHSLKEKLINIEQEIQGKGVKFDNLLLKAINLQIKRLSTLEEQVSNFYRQPIMKVLNEKRELFISRLKAYKQAPKIEKISILEKVANLSFLFHGITLRKSNPLIFDYTIGNCKLTGNTGKLGNEDVLFIHLEVLIPPQNDSVLMHSTLRNLIELSAWLTSPRIKELFESIGYKEFVADTPNKFLIKALSRKGFKEAPISWLDAIDIALSYRNAVKKNTYPRYSLIGVKRLILPLSGQTLGRSRALNINNKKMEFQKTGVNLSADRAMNVVLKRTPGGIDLNPAPMNMQVKKDGQDFKFDFNGTEIDAAQVTGASFTIRTMTPVTNLPLILGLNQEPSNNSKQEMSVSA